jgi:hypothetical protein
MDPRYSLQPTTDDALDPDALVVAARADPPAAILDFPLADADADPVPCDLCPGGDAVRRLVLLLGGDSGYRPDCCGNIL